MAVTDNIKKLMDAGVHFGHLTRKWNPNMAPYIFMERNGIHVIDLHKTDAKLTEASLTPACALMVSSTFRTHALQVIPSIFNVFVSRFILSLPRWII